MELCFYRRVWCRVVVYATSLTQYVDTYAVRVRPRKETEEVAGEQPKDRAILQAMKAIGEVVLSVLPGLADKDQSSFSPRLTTVPKPTWQFTRGSNLYCWCGNLYGLKRAGTPWLLFLVPFAALLGWMLPNFFLAGRVKTRQAQILKELPTVIDLLIVCAQAGLGLLMAVDKVSREIDTSCPVLAIELQQLIQDVKLFAKSVPIALKEMGERCGVDELINMASA